MITIALPKGRTLKATLERFARAGLSPEVDFAMTRKLIVQARGGAAQFLLLKGSDVPLYVERGVKPRRGRIYRHEPLRKRDRRNRETRFGARCRHQFVLKGASPLAGAVGMRAIERPIPSVAIPK